MTPALLFALLSVQTGGRVYFVAPGGADANPGSMARPFATIQRAQEAVRAYRKQTSDPHPVTVMIRAGVYRLAAPLTFGKEDSGTVRAPALYRAFGSERPTITGGYPVTAFRPGSGRVMAADLRGTALEGADIRVVTYQGKRLEMARYPNRDVTDPHGGRWAHVDGKRIGMYEDSPGPAEGDATGKDFWQRNRPELTRTLRMRADDTRRTGNVRGGEVSVFPRFNWNHYILPILDVEDDGRTLRLGEGSFYEIRPGDRYFVRGLRSLLDVPNEWHWDRATSELAWIPPERRASYTLEAARLGNLIELDGASHVALQGLTLECANGSGIVMRNCDNVRVAACTVRNVGDALGDGIVIESGSHNAIVGCDIHDVGNTGIRLGGGDHFALAPGGNRVVNSYIHHVGRVGKHGNGIAVTGAMHTISRNLIHDTPHSGIFMWGSGHTVEFNRIRHTCLETEDSGAIGGGAIDWLSWHGVTIRYNRIEDTLGYGFDEGAGRWRSPYFAAALYPDWAASGVRIIGNVLVRAPRTCLMLHSGRDNVIENNILVDGGESVCQWAGWTTSTGFWSSMVEGWIRNWKTARDLPQWKRLGTLRDPRTVPLPDGSVMHGNVFRRNILVAGDPGSAVFRWEGVPMDANRSDRNVIWAAGRPIRTGRLVAKSVHGPNMIENAGAEAGPVGSLPSAWAWLVKGAERAEVAVVEGTAHAGSRSVLIHHSAGPAAPGALTMVAPGKAYPFVPGAVYRLEVWLRADAEHMPVNLEAYTWKAGTHSWTASERVTVGLNWRRYGLTFRLPERSSALYRPSMDTWWVRISVPARPGSVWVDDVDLRRATPTDEWTAWRQLGQDRNSVVADPMFVNAARGDYRLKPASPALKRGFVPIPFERIGPYMSPDRASWPIREAPGARESYAEGAVRGTPRRPLGGR